MNDPLGPAMRDAAGRLSVTLNLGTRSAADSYRHIGGTAIEGGEQLRGAAQRAEADILESRPTQRVHRTAPTPTASYRPSDAEAAMAARRMTAPVEFTGDARELVWHSSTEVRLMRSAGNELSVYKPIHGERAKWDEKTRLYFTYTPGSLTGREVAAYRIDEIFGFGRVPPTARTAGIIGSDGKPRGPGMIQQFVESGPARRIEEYDVVQQQQVAVLDYIIGAFDRSPGNFRTVDHGDGHLDLVAIDHGRSFPEAMNPLDIPINSPFVAVQRGEPLKPEVFEALRGVDIDHLRAAIENAGNLRPNAVDGALARFREILSGGRIPRNATLHPELKFPE